MRARTPAGSATGSRPKTRTEPACARSKPRTCLMSVVLPAPLTPTRPKTMPRGSVRLTPTSAVVAPKRRVSALTSTTGSRSGDRLAIMGSFLLGLSLHGLVTLADEANEFVQVDAQLAGLGQQGVGTFGQDAQALAPGQG